MRSRMSKPKNFSRRRQNNNNRRSNNLRQGRSSNRLQGQETGDSRRLPPTTSAVDRRPRYNPTWNPQYFKVARSFDYSSPNADFMAGYSPVTDPGIDSATLSAIALSHFSAAYQFKIDDVPGISEFTTMYDQYRISRVSLEFNFMTASESVVDLNPTGRHRCTLLLIEDQDDATAFPNTNAGWSAALETGRAIRHVFPNKTNRVVYNLRPKVLTGIVDTAGTVLARGLASPWLDASTTDAKYNALKIMMQGEPASSGGDGYFFRVFATYYLEWRARQ